MFWWFFFLEGKAFNIIDISILHRMCLCLLNDHKNVSDLYSKHFFYLLMQTFISNLFEPCSSDILFTINKFLTNDHMN